jgi:hypothetical protein
MIAIAMNNYAVSLQKLVECTHLIAVRRVQTALLTKLVLGSNAS